MYRRVQTLNWEEFVALSKEIDDAAVAAAATAASTPAGWHDVVVDK
jgi:hypothetical protein